MIQQHEHTMAICFAYLKVLIILLSLVLFCSEYIISDKIYIKQVKYYSYVNHYNYQIRLLIVIFKRVDCVDNLNIGCIKLILLTVIIDISA